MQPVFYIFKSIRSNNKFVISLSLLYLLFTKCFKVDIFDQEINLSDISGDNFLRIFLFRSCTIILQSHLQQKSDRIWMALGLIRLLQVTVICQFNSMSLTITLGRKTDRILHCL